jgi:hypothetical protein
MNLVICKKKDFDKSSRLFIKIINRWAKDYEGDGFFTVTATFSQAAKFESKNEAVEALNKFKRLDKTPKPGEWEICEVSKMDNQYIYNPVA